MSSPESPAKETSENREQLNNGGNITDFLRIQDGAPVEQGGQARLHGLNLDSPGGSCDHRLNAYTYFPESPMSSPMYGMAQSRALMNQMQKDGSMNSDKSLSQL